MARLAELPDGRKLSFPDDTDDEVIDFTVKRELGLNEVKAEKIEPQIESAPKQNIPTLTLDQRIDLFAESFVDTLKTQGAEAAKSFTNPKTIEDALIMSGATLGGVAGSPLGFGGMAGGAALGAMMGKELDNAIEGIEPNVDTLKSTLKEGVMELAGLKVADVFTGKLMDVGMAKVLGVSDKASEFLSDKALRQRIDLGITDVGNQIAKGSKTVLGVFPFLASPFRKATLTQQDQVLKGIDTKLNNIAPNTVMSKLGIDMTKAAENSFKEFKTVASSLYKTADDLADSLPDKDIVPTIHIKKVLKELKEAKPSIQTTDGKTVKRPTDGELDEYLSGLEEAGENISVRQLRGIQEDLGVFFDKAKIQGFDTVKLARLKEATDQSMFALDLSRVPSEQAVQIRKAYSNANTFFADNMKRFETSTAKKFGRVDRNIFKSGAFKSGSLNEDEIVQSVFNSKSAQAIKDLRSIVGDDQVMQASRIHFKKVFDSAKSVDKDSGNIVFNPAVIKEKLGMIDDEGTDAVAEMLKGTNQTAQDLREFLDVAEQVGKIVMPATFVKRRFVLGGVNSALRTFTLGAIGAGGTAVAPPSLFLSVPAIYLLRRGGKFLTDPNALKNLTKIMDDTLPDKQRRALAVRMLRLSLQDDGERVKDIDSPAL